MFKILCIICLFPFSLFAQQGASKALNLEFLSTTKAIFLAPAIVFSMKKNYPNLGFLIGRHHTLNALGLGIKLGNRYFPNQKQNRFNLFFNSDFQAVLFTNFSSPSIQRISVLQLSIGYGVNWKIQPRLHVITFFSLGLLQERRKFIQNIDPSTHYDTAGTLSIGLNYAFNR